VSSKRFREDPPGGKSWKLFLHEGRMSFGGRDESLIRQRSNPLVSLREQRLRGKQRHELLRAFLGRERPQSRSSATSEKTDYHRDLPSPFARGRKSFTIPTSVPPSRPRERD